MKEKIKLTEKEIKVLKSYMVDDFVIDLGWNDPESSTWVKDFYESCNLSKTSFAGILSSLCQKGFCWTNGEAFGLTEYGITNINLWLINNEAPIEYN